MCSCFKIQNLIYIFMLKVSHFMISFFNHTCGFDFQTKFISGNEMLYAANFVCFGKWDRYISEIKIKPKLE